MLSLSEKVIFQRLGEDGFTKLVQGFYTRVKTDDILGPMYPQQDMEGAEKRLRDFLLYRFGGPDRYTTTRGHPRLRMRHMPFAVDAAARDRWVKLMTESLEETTQDPEVKEILLTFFRQTAEFMRNRD